MLPMQIHFVWLGPMPRWVVLNLIRFRELNPYHWIRVQRSDRELLPRYRERYDQATTVSMQADLLRISLLEKYGGWYFDLDTYALRPVIEIEEAYDIGDRVFLPTYAGYIEVSNPILGAAKDCAAWPTIHQMVEDSAPAANHLEYANGLWTDLREKHPELLCLGDPGDFGMDGQLLHESYAHLMDGHKTKTSAFAIHGHAGLGTNPAVTVTGA